MLGCLDHKCPLNSSAWNKYAINITSIEHSFEIIRQSRNHLFSKLHITMLAKAGTNGDPIATPSTCL